MSGGALKGVGVLVTRPEHQAMPLCRMLAAEGADCVRLAAIEIQPLAERHRLAERLQSLDRYELIVFVSANAVRFGAALLAQKRDLPLAAVGPATLRALNQAGYRVSILPESGFDSEGLLAHPRLQHLEGRRVLIVKGVGGRDLLATTLQSRGALVDHACVYERLPATPTAAELAQLVAEFAPAPVKVITATSLDIGAHLLSLATPELRGLFDHAHWLVPSARIDAGLAQLGLSAPRILAASAEDHDLVTALLRWRAGESAA
jgi:uroporphyrinogen-III synthase